MICEIYYNGMNFLSSDKFVTHHVAILLPLPALTQVSDGEYELLLVIYLSESLMVFFISVGHNFFLKHIALH